MCVRAVYMCAVCVKRGMRTTGQEINAEDCLFIRGREVALLCSHTQDNTYTHSHSHTYKAVHHSKKVRETSSVSALVCDGSKLHVISQLSLL